MPLTFWYYAILYCLPFFDTNIGQNTIEVIVYLLPLGITNNSSINVCLIPTQDNNNVSSGNFDLLPRQ